MVSAEVEASLLEICEMGAFTYSRLQASHGFYVAALDHKARRARPGDEALRCPLRQRSSVRLSLFSAQIYALFLMAGAGAMGEGTEPASWGKALQEGMLAVMR